ncbi:hypothetical protein LJC15_00695 [Desulfovibrio sp. OttesenSCG-928-G11]|nr:hypothetical protein [Desulfovibrio sp. OttesenSCG-928-G11]
MPQNGCREALSAAQYAIAAAMKAITAKASLYPIIATLSASGKFLRAQDLAVKMTGPGTAMLQFFPAARKPLAKAVAEFRISSFFPLV